MNPFALLASFYFSLNQAMSRAAFLRLRLLLALLVATFSLPVQTTASDSNKAIELDPKLLSNRGWAKQTKGDLDGALADYSKAIQLKPDYATAYSNRGGVKRAEGDLFGAMNDLDKAAELNAPRIQR